MQSKEVKALIESRIVKSTAEVEIEGSHVHLTVVSSEFQGLTPVKKQQLVYAALSAEIASGVIHAVHMKTFTPEEYQQKNA